MRKSLITKGSLASLLALGLLGCAEDKTYYSEPAYQTREVVVSQPPPPVVVEERTVAPRTSYVYVEGNWRWHNNRWEWEKGHWVNPPYHGANWVPAHYY